MKLNEAQIRSPKWLRKFFDFELTTGKDVYPEAKAKRKQIEDDELRKEMELKNKIKQFEKDWNKVVNDKIKKDYFVKFLKFKGINTNNTVESVKKGILKKEYFDIFMEFESWYSNERSREEREQEEKRERDRKYAREKAEAEYRRERERREREKKMQDEERQKKKKADDIERDLNILYRNFVNDFNSAPYNDKFDTPLKGGETSFEYRFENGNTILIYGKNLIFTDVISGFRTSYTLSLLWANIFIKKANEIIHSAVTRKGRSYSQSQKSSQSSQNSYVHKETPKTGDPIRDKYNLLNDKIRLREEQLKGMDKNNPDRESLENELKSYKKVRDRIKQQNKFESKVYKFSDFSINEGRYDSITRLVVRDIMNYWKSEFNGKTGDIEFEDEYELIDSKGKTIEFDLLAVLRIKKTKDSDYIADGGVDPDEPYLEIKFQVDPRNLPYMWEEIYYDLIDVVRHEIEHFTQMGFNMIKSKEMEEDDIERGLINSKLLSKSRYYQLPMEVDAMLQGMYLKSKKMKVPLSVVIDMYFDKVKIPKKDRKEVLDLWKKRAKELSIKL